MASEGDGDRDCCMAWFFLMAGFSFAFLHRGTWQEPLSTIWAFHKSNVVVGTCTELTTASEQSCPVFERHDYSKGADRDRSLQAIQCRPIVRAEVLMTFAPTHMLESGISMTTEPKQKRKASQIFGGRWRDCADKFDMDNHTGKLKLKNQPKESWSFGASLSEILFGAPEVSACPANEYHPLKLEATAWQQNQLTAFQSDGGECFKFRDQTGEVLIFENLDPDSMGGSVELTPFGDQQFHDARKHPKMFSSLADIEAEFVSPMHQLRVGSFYLCCHMQLLIFLCFCCYPMTRGRKLGQWNWQTDVPQAPHTTRHEPQTTDHTPHSS